MTIAYRPDIDGLRALAVIPVVLFHLDISLFSGGFVGVDIFFVISGYLITKILLKDINENQFSITKFYERRVRRIFPALFTVLIATTAVAYWLYFNGEFKQYQSSLLSTLFFYSNYFFMFDIDYFAAPAETKPLLHMWSLAVEEQFYLFFPIILFLIARYKKQWLGGLVIALAAVSLIYASVLINYYPSDAFYSTPARAWELLAGGILAIYPTNKQFNNKLAVSGSLLGLGLVVYSVFFFTPETPFPGLTALLPVVGTVLLIYFGSNSGNTVAKVFALPILRWPGLISYSLYLWHWPVIVLYKLYMMRSLEISDRVIILVLVTLLSFLSWKYIENPFRKARLRRSRTFVSAAGLAIVLTFSALLITSSLNLNKAYDKQTRQMLASMRDSAKRLESCRLYTPKGMQPIDVCGIGDTENTDKSFVLYGDSHGNALRYALDASAKKNGKHGVSIAHGGCLPLLGVHQIRQGYEKCQKQSRTFIHYLENNPSIETVVLISRWAIYAEGVRYQDNPGTKVFIRDDFSEKVSLPENRLVFMRSFERTLEKLKSMNKKIVVVQQVPEVKHMAVKSTIRADMYGRTVDLRSSVEDYQQRQNYVHQVMDELKRSYDFTILKPQELMCGDSHCELFKNNKAMYSDTSHITNAFSKSLSPLFDPLFDSD